MTKIKNIFSPAFFNILKEPLVVQKQTIHQQKARVALSGAYFVEFYGRAEGF
jgi:hypothetical protein